MSISNTDIRHFLKNFDSIADLLEPARRSQDAGAQMCSQQEVLVLRAITRNGSLKMGELAELTMVPLSTATRIVDHLAEKGLVERSKSEQDRRIVQVSFTRLGSQIDRYIQKERTAQAKKMLNGLTEKQREQFFQQLERILDN